MKNRHFRFFFCINLTPNKSLLKKNTNEKFYQKERYTWTNFRN
ncbi:MAG: hypothetical protein ACI9XO_004196 [Paraglaciecola sp.]|jgi:hypothetical protein